MAVWRDCNLRSAVCRSARLRGHSGCSGCCAAHKHSVFRTHFGHRLSRTSRVYEGKKQKSASYRDLLPKTRTMLSCGSRPYLYLVRA